MLATVIPPLGQFRNWQHHIFHQTKQFCAGYIRFQFWWFDRHTFRKFLIVILFKIVYRQQWPLLYHASTNSQILIWNPFHHLASTTLNQTTVLTQSGSNNWPVGCVPLRMGHSISQLRWKIRGHHPPPYNTAELSFWWEKQAKLYG